MMSNKLLYITAVALLIGEIFSEYNITVVHIGDFHSHWFEFNDKEEKCSNVESTTGKCFGGFPRLLNMVRDIRKNEKNVIVLSSGEFFLQQSMIPLHWWNIANVLVPKLELDAMSLASHDFGSDTSDLSIFLYAMNFPVVCANLQAKQTSYINRRVKKSAIIDVNGEKVGVVGYVHLDTLLKSKPVTNVKFFPEIPAIQDEVAELESKSINKIIALGHSDFYMDLEIAESIEGVDLVIGGNSDIVLEKPVNGNANLMTEKNIPGKYPMIQYHIKKRFPLKKNLALHIPQHGKYVGVFRLTFDDKGNVIHENQETVLLDSFIPQDMEALNYLNKVRYKPRKLYRNSNIPHYDESLVTVSEDFMTSNCRMEECAVGNLVTDAMMEIYRMKKDEKSWGQVDAVLFNSGSIRRPLLKGSVTITELMRSLYLGDIMNRVRVSGKQLKQIFEHSVSNFATTGFLASGTFLQVSGILVKYDLSQVPGKRVKDLAVSCRNCDANYFEVKAEKYYFILLPSLIARETEADGFPVFEKDDLRDIGYPQLLMLLEYLTKQKFITPYLDNRIQINAVEAKTKKEDTTFPYEGFIRNLGELAISSLYLLADVFEAKKADEVLQNYTTIALLSILFILSLLYFSKRKRNQRNIALQTWISQYRIKKNNIEEIQEKLQLAMADFYYPPIHAYQLLHPETSMASEIRENRNLINGITNVTNNMFAKTRDFFSSHFREFPPLH